MTSNCSFFSSYNTCTGIQTIKIEDDPLLAIKRKGFVVLSSMLTLQDVPTNKFLLWIYLSKIIMMIPCYDLYRCENSLTQHWLRGRGIQPPGFEGKFGSSMSKLRKSHYGLKQSPRVWLEKFT